MQFARLLLCSIIMANLLEHCPVLREMLETRTSLNPAGEHVRIISNISQSFAEALYDTVLKNRPAVALEVGMAFGFSSLSILTALRDVGQPGRLITIDPNQSTDWNSCGRTAVSRAGLADRHELIEDFDYAVLPRLLDSAVKIDFAYIDGWHTFDYTLIDWWYIDKMMPTGGIVAFNDCGFPAVEKVIQFVLSHRSYVEFDVGLPRVMKDGRRTEDRYFRKTGTTEPAWNFFAPF
jgi:predicted O-methyltransferase YrrM